MKTVFVILALVAMQDAQRADNTAIAATQGAMVTIEKAPAPSPLPKPATDGAQVGGPIDTFRDVKALIDKGNNLADRGKALLDQAQRDGKITLDIRLPTPVATTLPTTCPPGGVCRNGLCPLSTVRTTPPADNPQTLSRPGGTCPGGVCPYCPSTEQAAPADTATTVSVVQRSGVAGRVRHFLRWRR